MPNRIVREGLLDSERYWSVTIEARQLFWHLLLLADDLGCVSLAPVFIRRRCFDGAPAQSKIDSLVTHLMDSDLIRVYEVDGARYAFIPRYRQRLKRATSKHPEPPTAILQGDDDARQKFKLIKGKAENPAAAGPPDGGHRAAEEKRREGKRSEEKKDIANADGVPPCPHQAIIGLYAKHLPTGVQPKSEFWNGARAMQLQARWREAADRQNLDWWEKFFAYCAKSRFLTGQTSTPGRKPFRLSLAWLVNKENFAKVNEGNYDEEFA